MNLVTNYLTDYCPAVVRALAGRIIFLHRELHLSKVQFHHLSPGTVTNQPLQHTND